MGPLREQCLCVPELSTVILFAVVDDELFIFCKRRVYVGLRALIAESARS